jgi:biotin carboxylase
VQLVGDTEEQVERDFEAIHDNEELGMIDYSVICPTPPAIGAVVVVDPFSSGANLAAMVLLWGYKLILVFSEQDSPVANLVTKGSKVEPTLLVQHDSTSPNQAAAIKTTLAAITGQGSPILAIIPGAETGVELADKLAQVYGTRCNRAVNNEARRNKFNMQAVLSKQGKVRTIQQELCRSTQQVEDFVAKLTRAGITQCVLKPNQSAGSDSVSLCSTEEERAAAFHSVHGQINGLGQINDGVLVQEYLQGTEFAVDGVSRDGVYKIIAVWEYDKRAVNGANFVYHGMSLRDAVSGDNRVRAVMEYAREVMKGLQITQGPTHIEIMCETIAASTAENPNAKPTYSPCLVEIGTRCHGGEATWLPVAVECTGTTLLCLRWCLCSLCARFVVCLVCRRSVCRSLLMLCCISL